MKIELPDYDDIESIKKQLSDLNKQIKEKESEIKVLQSLKNALYSMCDHKYKSDGDRREPSYICTKCGHYK